MQRSTNTSVGLSAIHAEIQQMMESVEKTVDVSIVDDHIKDAHATIDCHLERNWSDHNVMAEASSRSSGCDGQPRTRMDRLCILFGKRSDSVWPVPRARHLIMKLKDMRELFGQIPGDHF